jgi:hypothetical protein
MAPEPPSTEPPHSGIKIHNWPDAEDPIDDNTELVRYMKLETFLLLLNQRLFIPTIQALKAKDRWESLVPARADRLYYGRRMQPIVLPHEDWLDKVALGKTEPKEHQLYPTTPRLRSLTDVWLHELGRRRLVWCWNRSVDDLDAMWKLYANRGIVIYSTVGKIRKALAKAGAEGLVSPVAYVHQRPPKPSVQKEQQAFLATMLPEYLARPYLFKDAGFRLEEEVRFVVRVNPSVTNKLHGALVEIAPQDFFNSFNVSDDLPRAEKHLVALLGDGFLRKELKLPLPNGPISGLAVIIH